MTQHWQDAAPADPVSLSQRRSVPKRLRHKRAVLSRRGVPAGHGNHLSADRGADADDVARSLSLHCSVDGGAGDAEQVGELSGAVLAAIEQSHQVSFLPMVQLGLLATQTPFGLGDLHSLSCAQPNQLGLETRRPSRTLNSSRPTGSVGSYTDPPRLNRTWPAVSSSAMALASGSDRASRSSLMTTSVSPSRQAARASRRPGRSLFVPVSPWSTYTRFMSTPNAARPSRWAVRSC